MIVIRRRIIHSALLIFALLHEQDGMAGKSTTGSSGRGKGARFGLRTQLNSARVIKRLKREGLSSQNIISARRSVRTPQWYSSGGSAQLVPGAVRANGLTASLPGLEPHGDALFTTKIPYQGSRTADFDLAWKRTPRGFRKEFTYRGTSYGTKDLVWHHYHDYSPSPQGGMGHGTMVLMFRSVHDTMHHSGGVWQANQYNHGHY